MGCAAWSCSRSGSPSAAADYEYITERYVHAVPSAILAAAVVLLAFFTLGLGLILNSTNLHLLELERLITKRLARIDDSRQRLD